MTLIDAHLPVNQFRELHQLLINAAPGDLLDAVTGKTTTRGILHRAPNAAPEDVVYDLRTIARTKPCPRRPIHVGGYTRPHENQFHSCCRH